MHGVSGGNCYTLGVKIRSMNIGITTVGRKLGSLFVCTGFCIFMKYVSIKKKLPFVEN